MKHNQSSSSMDWFSWLSKTTLDTSHIYEYGLVFARNELQFDDITYFNHEFLQSMGISVAKHRLEILKLARKENGGTTKSLSRLIWAISKTRKSLVKYFSKLAFHDQEMSLKDFPDSAQSREYWKGVLLRRQRSEELKEDRPVLKTRSMALSGPIDGRVHERLMAPNNTRNLKLSGPLDGRMHDRLLYTNRSPRFTRTLDGRAIVPERLMIPIPNNWSPKLSGPLDYRADDRALSINRNPKLSGPLDGRAMSPKFCTPYEKDKGDDDFDDHSLWSALFQDMKPT
ncbi:uncharacterized protein LOC107415710 [Ziziphus jujuba]|uniref:Uncharacterized protein LOC107415710 n=2 Tax=Ziziphus jujuba TaxID=326968 RepID=A0A6P3ZLK6_ZIZJJ|nr:uncharacterized protein LOC107415710 [Ziziphus jujuba]KAH7546284.1 hypothetical protein FEM48_Zijuj01G0183900 [Ziziphus jujuba var. spinosa]